MSGPDLSLSRLGALSWPCSTTETRPISPPSSVAEGRAPRGSRRQTAVPRGHDKTTAVITACAAAVLLPSLYATERGADLRTDAGGAGCVGNARDREGGHGAPSPGDGPWSGPAHIELRRAVTPPVAEAIV